MKKIIPILILLFISCKETKQEIQSENNLQLSGKELFTTNNCGSCHQVDQKIIGPSLNEIAEIYKKNNASMVGFLKGEAEPIVDETQYEIMKINLEVTKTMTNEELQAIENYIKNPAE